MCHVYGEQVMITLVTFSCALVLISFKTFMGMVIEDECLFQQPTYPLLLVHPYARYKSPSNVTPPFP